MCFKHQRARNATGSLLPILDCCVRNSKNYSLSSTRGQKRSLVLFIRCTLISIFHDPHLSLPRSVEAFLTRWNSGTHFLTWQNIQLQSNGSVAASTRIAISGMQALTMADSASTSRPAFPRQLFLTMVMTQISWVGSRTKGRWSGRIDICKSQKIQGNPRAWRHIKLLIGCGLNRSASHYIGLAQFFVCDVFPMPDIFLDLLRVPQAIDLVHTQSRYMLWERDTWIWSDSACLILLSW